MVWTLTLLVLCLGTVPEFASASTKKGLCITATHHMCGDFNAFSHVNWWYDWTKDFWVLTHSTSCKQFAPHWVSMVWGWRHYADYPVYIPNEAEYILGFNEPNHVSQANMVPEVAAQHWPEIERNSRGLPLVSPAAAPCGGGASQCHGDTTDWFDKFFQHCSGCRVDYLATHYYSCNADQTMSFLESLYHKYGKKIWLTEFACPHTTSVDTQLNYMKAVLPRLEAADYVFRYSWYSSRVDNDGFVTTSASLLERHESRLTRLGQFYDSFQGSSHIVG